MMLTNMEGKSVSDNEQVNPLGHLTRQQLKELEQKEKARGQKILGFVIMALPVICGFTVIIEYWEVFNGSLSNHPYTYVRAVTVFMTTYILYTLEAGIENRRGDKWMIESLYYRAPLVSAFFLLLTVHDYLILKTGILSQPFVPCMNGMSSIARKDRAYLLEYILHTLRLLFLGYFIGIVLGLVAGIVYGYFKKARYWINPIIKFLGPILTVTWTPIIMVVAASLFRGAVFIITLGSWFAVIVVPMSGIQNVDKDFFEAARTPGASERQLVFRVAIPHIIPSILQGHTQAMSFSCVAIMTVEVMGVKAGLGWYMNQAKSWAAYDKVFATLFVIYFIFAIVTKMLNLIRRRILRWQNGVVK